MFRTVIAVAAAGVLVQQPAFRSRVDLIRLDVTVVDKDGRPVRDLRAEDFVVTIDGASRRVAFAQFYGPPDVLLTTTADAAVSVATNTSATPGRVVVIVADLESIAPGSEKIMFDTAARLIERLGPTDAVGLLALPGPGVEVTRDRSKVSEALQKLRGFASPPSSRYTLSVREAEAFRNNDRRVIAEVFERECRPSDDPCPVEIRSMVMPMLQEADRRTQIVLSALTTLFERLGRLEAPKAVVLLSAGLQRRQGGISWFNDLQRRADVAGVSTSIVQIEQSDNDASRRSAARMSRAELTDGLSAVAGAVNGTMYFGVGRAVGAFDRIRNEIVHSYQLGVESSPEDADDRKHRTAVDVKRSDVTVRARKEMVIPKAPRTILNPVELLSQPVDFTEAPLAVATYMTRGDEPSTLKVIVLVELLGASSESAAASYAFTIGPAEGKPAFETADRMTPGRASATVAAQVAPGRYRLRAAVVDDAGRPGSLDMPIIVGLRQAGALQFSDLILGRTGDTFIPATRTAAGVPVSGLLELYSADPAQLEGLAVTLEARRAGDARPPLQVPAAVRTSNHERRRIAAVELPDRELAPGTWLVSAIVRRGDAVLGQVSRTLVVEAPVSGPAQK